MSPHFACSVNMNKQARDNEFNAIEKEALEPYLEDEEMYPEVKSHIKNMFKNTVRKTVLDKKVRVDGRGLGRKFI